MKKTRVLILLMLVVLMAALVGCSGTDDADTVEETGFEVGDTVAAEWVDGRLYLSEITAVEDDQITVTYLDDSSSGTVDESQVRAIDEKDWKVDDRVLAVWATARFYSGTVTEVLSDGYTVDWDDGSSPSMVTADMIIAYEKAYADEPMDTGSDDGVEAEMSDLVGDWTNTGGMDFAELSLDADGTGTATDVDGTTVDCTWSFVDGYLEVILTDTDGTEITLGATMVMDSANEFTWDAETGSFVR
jgi:hypothetical protein